MNTTNAKVLTVYTRGDNLSAVTDGLRDAWRNLYRFTLLQVWTWRGGEAIVACDYGANYGRGEYRVVVRTGGLKRGAVRILFVNCFADAMQQLGIPFRCVGAQRPRRERSKSELNRAVIARAARRSGNTFHTLHARPARLAA